MKTRKDVRRDVAKALGDLMVLTSTRNSTSNVVFMDEVNLTGEVGAYDGRQVLFTGGQAANLGLERYVGFSSSSQRSLGFNIALPVDVIIGDECELINTRGTGFRFQDVHDAINQSIRTISDRFLEPAATEESVYTYGSGIILPSEFQTVENVQWQDPCDSSFWRTLPKAPRANGLGWWVDRPSRMVMVTGQLRNFYPCQDTTRTVRVWGLQEPVELYDDRDTTSVSYDWLVSNTRRILAEARFATYPMPELERMIFAGMQRADQLLPRVVTRRGPFSVSL